MPTATVITDELHSAAKSIGWRRDGGWIALSLATIIADKNTTPYQLRRRFAHAEPPHLALVERFRHQAYMGGVFNADTKQTPAQVRSQAMAE